MEINKDLKLNAKMHNSISYENNNHIIRPYTSNTARNNTNMISVRVSKNTKSKEKKINNNNNQIIIKANNTNIISYLDKKKKLINPYPINNNNINSNIIHSLNYNNINLNTNIINNNRVSKHKNEFIIKSQINNKENIDTINNPRIKTEYKISIIQYDNNTRTRRSFKSDIKSDINKNKKIKIKYFDESKITNVQIPKDRENAFYSNRLVNRCPFQIWFHR